MHDGCTVYRTMEYLSKKWALVILFELSRREGWTGFSELRSGIGRITPKVLSERSKDLEGQGPVGHRVDASEFPVRSEYSLTESGREPVPIVREIKMWALRWKMDNVPCMNPDCMRCRLRGPADPIG